MSRTRKAPYQNSRRFDSSCRNHGSCPWCAGNRQHKYDREDALLRMEGIVRRNRTALRLLKDM